MSRLFRSFILLALMSVSVKGICQITADNLREGLKGKVAVEKITYYGLYPDIINSSSVSLFDAQGYIVNAVYSDSLQSPAQIWKFKYDNKKKLLKLTKIKSGKILSVYTNIYDTRGYLVQQNMSTNEADFFKPVKYFFKYNKKSQLIEVYSEKYGTFSSKPYLCMSK
jgi:hypothetical protein